MEVHFQVGVAAVLVEGRLGCVRGVGLAEAELLLEPVGHAVGVGVVGGLSLVLGPAADVDLAVDEALYLAGGACIGGGAVLRFLGDAGVDGVACEGCSGVSRDGVECCLGAVEAEFFGVECAGFLKPRRA